MSNPYTRKEPHLRIQKSRSGKFVMFVLVYWDKDGVKHQQYFSTSFYVLHSYLNAQTKSYFIYGEQMINKDDPKYKQYLEEKSLIEKNKTKKESKIQAKKANNASEAEQENINLIKKQEINQKDSADDPITLKMPLKLG